MNSALVSIIIPSYNRGNLIGETLDSILEQTYENWECIVVDDGSTDNTETVLQQYWLKDKRFSFFKRPGHLPKGANTCRNIGYELSKGEYIQWLDSDDAMASDKLNLQVEALQQNSVASIAICKFGYFSEMQKRPVRDRVKTYRNFKNGLALLYCFGKYAEYFPSHVFLTKRTVIDKAGIWDEALEINQDGEYFTRVLLEAKGIVFVNTAVYYRRTRSDNVSFVTGADKAQKLIDCWKLIQQHISSKKGLKDHIYVTTAKSVIYNKLKDEYPVVVDMNTSFFEVKIPFYKRIFNLK